MHIKHTHQAGKIKRDQISKQPERNINEEREDNKENNSVRGVKQIAATQNTTPLKGVASYVNVPHGDGGTSHCGKFERAHISQEGERKRFALPFSAKILDSAPFFP